MTVAVGASLTQSEIDTIRGLSREYRMDVRVFQTPDGRRHIRWATEQAPSQALLVYLSQWNSTANSAARRSY